MFSIQLLTSTIQLLCISIHGSDFVDTRDPEKTAEVSTDILLVFYGISASLARI